jgi:hypothetical protein
LLRELLLDEVLLVQDITVITGETWIHEQELVSTCHHRLEVALQFTVVRRRIQIGVSSLQVLQYGLVMGLLKCLQLLDL